MRIGINAQLLGNRKTGLEQYINKLIEHLSILDDENSYTIFSPVLLNTGKNNFVFDTTEHSIGTGMGRILWEHLFLPKKIKKLDLFHSPAVTLPIYCPAKSIVTIHDLAFFLYPETYRGNLNLAYLKMMVPLTLKKAARIIAVSENTKNDLIKILKVPEKKVEVIHLGIDNNFCRIVDAERLKEVSKKYNLPARFLLYLGAINPRKNLVRLITAFHILKKRYGLRHKLVIAGGVSWKISPVLKAIKKFNLGQEVIFPGFIDDKDIAVVYSLADVFVYPSIYEGFGMPVLEAMACGIPVVTSHTSCFPEVVAEAAKMVNPLVVEEIADAIHSLINDQSLRNEMIERGLKRAGCFSWRDTARKTLAVYNTINQ